jgi:drug/metabolite transporter (DMT)-like permease
MLKAKVITVCLLWSLCYPFISVALSESPPLLLAFMRSVLAGVTLLLFSAKSADSVFPRGWRIWRSIGIIGLGYTTMGFSGMFLAGGLVSPGLATVIANSQPMIAVGLAYLYAVERVTPRQLTVLITGLAGISVIVLPSLHHDQANVTLAGIGFVLLGAFGVALGNVWLKKVASEFNILRLSAWQLIAGSIPLGIGGFLIESTQDITWGAPLALSLAVLAIPGTAMATYLWFNILKSENLHSMNAYTFLTPLFALAIGALFLGERLEVNELIGTAIIIGSLVFINTRSNRLAETPKCQPLAKTPR